MKRNEAEYEQNRERWEAEECRKAMDRGILIGGIIAMQDVLDLPVLDRYELRWWPIRDLEQLHGELRQRIFPATA